LAIALGRTLEETLGLPLGEFDFWKDFRSRNGFPADRIETAVAKIGAYLGYAWGGKATPSDLMPKFGRDEHPKVVSNPKGILAFLSTVPGCVVSDVRKRRNR
jgi:hypothetical protein